MSKSAAKEPFKPSGSKLNELTRISKNRSLIDSTGDTVFQISEPQVRFINTEPNESYEVAISVRNVSHDSQKIKIRKPLSPQFVVTASKEANIAAGLDFKVTILFNSLSNTTNITDRFFLVSDICEVEIPIYVNQEVAKLQFEPFINFGFVRLGSSKEASWEITNVSSKESQVKLIPEIVDRDVKITLNPSDFVLEPKKKITVMITIQSSEAGAVEGSVRIEPSSASLVSLDFVANFCQFSHMIADSQGNELSEVVFESMLAGQKAKACVFLVNNTPNVCEYRITRKKGGEEFNSLITPEQIGRDQTQKLINFSPTQGELKTYSSVEVCAEIQTKFEEADLQLFCSYILGKTGLSSGDKQWTYSLKVLISNDENPLSLTLKGTSIVPKIGLSSTFFKFGDCFLRTKNQKSLKIENFSKQKIAIQFENSQNYNFLPNKIMIGEREARIVNVIFSPKIVGDLNEICCLRIGKFEFPIKMFGRSLFGKSKFNNEIDNLKSVEVDPSEMNQTCLENQISSLNENQSTHSGSILRFESCYRSGPLKNSFQLNQKSLLMGDSTRKAKPLRNKFGRQISIDVKNLNPNSLVEPYPSQPKNPQQQRLVTRQLTSQELQGISVGPVIIDIGFIFIRSSQRKTFHICNFNQRPLAIALETGSHDCFCQTTDTKQILPAQSHGGFNIVFEATAEGPFKNSLQYVLNGCHFFELMVVGTAILPVVSLSKTEIRFQCSEEDKKFEKKETLQLANAYDYDLEYEWKTPKNSLFLIEPTAGTLKANSNLTVVLTHSFERITEFNTKIEEILKLKIIHGKTVEVKCSSYVQECICICKAQEVNFKEVSINKAHEVKIMLKNTSKNSTIYKVLLNKELEQFFTILPRYEPLPAEKMLEIVFKLQSSRAFCVESTVTIVIRGSKTIVLPLRATVISPSVCVEGDQIDFGSSPVEGNPAFQTVTLNNQSNIPVELDLRLFTNDLLSRGLKLTKLLDENMVMENKDKANKVILLRIKPKCKSAFLLEFSPEAMGDYEFKLPLFLNNSNELNEDLAKPCKGKGTKNRLISSQKQIEFGNIVIEQLDENYNKCQVLDLRNPQEQLIEWWIDESNIYPFRLDMNRGEIAGFGSQAVKIFFSADAAGDYCKEVDFYIDEDKASNHYFKVTLKGSACYPSLYFDQPYLILPFVNLKEVSTGQVEIFNGGYENINLKHSIVQDFSNIDIRVKYINGSNLGVTKKQTKVEVSFVSDKPISFTVKINFYDNSNRVFPLNVSGTCDSCIYTVPDEDSAQTADKNCSFLRNYINSIGCLTDELYEFPQSLFENEFQQLHLVLCNYSSTFQKVRSLVRRNSNLQLFSFEYLSEVIKLAKAEGGFLNHIRPEMLLPYEQYLASIKIRAENNQNALGYYRMIEKDQYEVSQKRTWVILFYQIFKIYSQINPGKQKHSEFWGKFLSREKLLLSWLEKTYQSQAGLDTPLSQADILQNFGNGEILCAMLSKYANIKLLDLYGKHLKSIKEKEKRCKAALQAFGKLGINCFCRVEDFLRSSEKEMLLISENLYLILPNYLQKGEPLIFSCCFGQVITKSIQISNPSKSPITYLAKIEGSKAYMLETDCEFTIEGKKSQEVRIKYVSNMNANNLTATLTFAGKATAKVTPSTFVFLLKSVSLGRIPEKSIHICANLYEPTQFPVKVTNNLFLSGEFKIQVVSKTISKCQSFFSSQNLVKIRQGETATVNVTFIPVLMESQTCCLVFKDEKVGEFEYQITGLVQKSIGCQETLRIFQNIYTNKSYLIDLPIPTKNEALLKARKAIEQLVQKQLDRKSSQKGAPNLEKFYPKLSNTQTFSVALCSPCSSVNIKSEHLTIRDIESTDETIKREDQKILLEVNVKYPIKEGSFLICLKSSSEADYRMYKVVLNAVAKPLKYELEMRSPINKSLTQPLPLLNLSSEVNTFLVTLTVTSTQSNRSVFSIDSEREVHVPAKGQETVNLCYLPRVQATCNAVLKVDNVTSGQIVEYEIIGISDEPEAEIVRFEQEVRKERNLQIKLPLSERSSKYIATSFTLVDAQYAKQFTATQQSPYFKFKFVSKTSGLFSGRLILEGEGKVLAYLVEIKVNTQIEAEMRLKTMERKQVTASITVLKGTYTVQSSDVNLKCASTCQIDEPTGSFPVSYYSSKPEDKEVLLTLFSSEAGEFLFSFKVLVEAIPEIKIQPFKAELSKSHAEIILLQNTDAGNMTVTGKCSNPNVFFLEPAIIVIPPHSKIQAKLIYKPSKLQLQEGKVDIISDCDSKWSYLLSGYGLTQSKPQVREVTVQLGEQACESITFRNPMSRTIQVNVSLETEDNAFSTILKQNKIQLKYNQELEVPITIESRNVEMSRAMLRIALNEKIFWRYEIMAKCICNSTEDLRLLKIPTRVKHEQAIDFVLPNSTCKPGERLMLNIIPSQGSSEQFLKSTLQASSFEGRSEENRVSFTLRALAFRPKHVAARLQISKEDGCKWVYKGEFHFLSPPADDSFEIVAAINKPTTVKFKIENRLKSHSKFNAYFSADSSTDFTVSPKSGELEPSGRGGSVFQVQFCPNQYKKEWHGKLVIETADSFWSYEVKGCLPHYNPPVGKSTIRG